ncbi:MAG: hypothetical protein IKO82_04240 [Prevotella sp.]|nr:hypothetical protein [Prevotella sp.]
MNIRTLTRAQSQKEYNSIKEGCDFSSIEWRDQLDDDYLAIRNYLENKYNELKQDGHKDYKLDYRYSLIFYDFFHQKEWMNDRIAADYDFWSYIALKVIPDLVFDRFGIDDDKHYYAKGLRIWPYTLYWYSLLSWQGDIESTKKILSSPRCCSDTILNLVERPGRNGTYIDLYRNIMYHFVNCNPTKAVDNIKLFRSIMKLALAKPQVIDPDLCSGGASEYAKEIVQECIEKIDFTTHG